MAHAQPQAVFDKGDDVHVPATEQPSTTTVHPKSAGSSHSLSENERAGGATGATEYVGWEHNPVLEEEAHSKGTWFAYVKTKQFWVVLVLGQGMCRPSKPLSEQY